MDIVDKLKSSHSLLGDPLHREAWEEIERSRKNEQILSIMLSRALTKQVSDEIAKKILNNEPVEVEI
jgi:hypothetical protein